MIKALNTIRFHGLTVWTLDPILVEKDSQFEAISCYRSKIFQDEFFDVMFENPITIARNTSIQLKVPVKSSCERYQFSTNDYFSMQSIQNGKAVDHIPIVGIFASKSTM